MASSPTTRTLDALRKQGYVCAIAEKWNGFAGIILSECKECGNVKRAGRRNDLFGFIDIIAIKPKEILAVQCTSSTNHFARKAEILALSEPEAWIKAGGRIEIWSWKKRFKGKKPYYESKVEKIHRVPCPF